MKKIIILSLLLLSFNIFCKGLVTFTVGSKTYIYPAQGAPLEVTGIELGRISKNIFTFTYGSYFKAYNLNDELIFKKMGVRNYKLSDNFIAIFEGAYVSVYRADGRLVMDKKYGVSHCQVSNNIILLQEGITYNAYSVIEDSIHLIATAPNTSEYKLSDNIVAFKNGICLKAYNSNGKKIVDRCGIDEYLVK